MSREIEHEAPPRSEIEGMTGAEIAEEYGVCNKIANRWLREKGLYEPRRDRAGNSSDLAQKLLEADPDDIGGES